MSLSQRNRNIILWVIAIGLLVSMVISFTPGTLFGGNPQDAVEGPVVLEVNGQPIRELEVARLRQNPPFNAVTEGPIAEDLNLVLVDQLVTQSLLEEAAAGVNVSSGEVRTRVNEFREEQGVAGSRNDRAYQDLLAGAGYTDATFRELIRQQLQQERYLENVGGETEPTDAEIETYYAANQTNYQSEPRITAREIVVADEAVASTVYARALAGEDFAALAREFSSERAEQGGALGAAAGESTPRPVGRVALPTAAADAAFALQGPGLTTPVQAGGAYHIVSVEALEPAATRPLEEVREGVVTDLTELKTAGAEEEAILSLKAQADIRTPEGSELTYDNGVVARVGDFDIRAADLNRSTYLNPQIQGLINPNFADLIVNSVKPNVLTQLIDEELAYQGSTTLEGGTFAGTRAAVAQSALGFVSRNTEVTDEQVRTYYQENRAIYTEPPTALVTRVNLPDADAARSFREALTGAETVDAEAVGIAAEAAGGTIEGLGNVTQGSQPEVIDAALFNFESGMTRLGDSGFDISSVLTVTTPAGAESGGAASGGTASGGAASPAREQLVVLVAARTPERVLPLPEVRAQAEQAALAQAQNTAQQRWLDGLRERIPVENLLASAQTPTDPSGGTASGGTASGGAAGDSVASDDAVPTLTPTPAPTPESGGAN